VVQGTIAWGVYLQATLLRAVRRHLCSLQR